MAEDNFIDIGNGRKLKVPTGASQEQIDAVLSLIKEKGADAFVLPPQAVPGNELVDKLQGLTKAIGTGLAKSIPNMLGGALSGAAYLGSVDSPMAALSQGKSVAPPPNPNFITNKIGDAIGGWYEPQGRMENVLQSGAESLPAGLPAPGSFIPKMMAYGFGSGASSELAGQVAHDFGAGQDTENVARLGGAFFGPGYIRKAVTSSAPKLPKEAQTEFNNIAKGTSLKPTNTPNIQASATQSYPEVYRDLYNTALDNPKHVPQALDVIEQATGKKLNKTGLSKGEEYVRAIFPGGRELKGNDYVKLRTSLAGAAKAATDPEQAETLNRLVNLLDTGVEHNIRATNRFGGSLGPLPKFQTAKYQLENAKVPTPKDTGSGEGAGLIGSLAAMAGAKYGYGMPGEAAMVAGLLGGDLAAKAAKVGLVGIPKMVGMAGKGLSEPVGALRKNNLLPTLPQQMSERTNSAILRLLLEDQQQQQQ